jgi:hypothetical protein
LAYFGILQSSFGKGQTIAQRILGFRTITFGGGYLNVGMSLLRAFLITFAVFSGFYGVMICNLFSYSVNVGLVIWGLKRVLILGYLLMAIYPQKRNLQDLLTGAVMAGDHELDWNFIKTLGKSRRAWISISLWSLLSVTILSIVSVGIWGRKYFPEMYSSSDNAGMLHKILSSQTRLINLAAWEKTDKVKNQVGMRCFVVDGFLMKNDFNDVNCREAQIQKVLQLVLSTSKRLKEVEQIRIYARTGFNIGIAKEDEFGGRTILPTVKNWLKKMVSETMGNNRIFGCVL